MGCWNLLTISWLSVLNFDPQALSNFADLRKGMILNWQFKFKPTLSCQPMKLYPDPLIVLGEQMQD